MSQVKVHCFVSNKFIDPNAAIKTIFVMEISRLSWREFIF